MTTKASNGFRRGAWRAKINLRVTSQRFAGTLDIGQGRKANLNSLFPDKLPITVSPAAVTLSGYLSEFVALAEIGKSCFITKTLPHQNEINGGFSKLSRNFIEFRAFSEFRESDKSLNWVQFKDSVSLAGAVVASWQVWTLLMTHIFVPEFSKFSEKNTFQ